MDKNINSAILACEDCVTHCLNEKKNDMNECISICMVNERIIKALKVCHKCQCDKKILNNLIKTALDSVNKCISVCSKHQDKHQHCKKCVEENSKLKKCLISMLSKKKKITNKVSV